AKNAMPTPPAEVDLLAVPRLPENWAKQVANSPKPPASGPAVVKPKSENKKEGPALVQPKKPGAPVPMATSEKKTALAVKADTDKSPGPGLPLVSDDKGVAARNAKPDKKNEAPLLTGSSKAGAPAGTTDNENKTDPAKFHIYIQ